MPEISNYLLSSFNEKLAESIMELFETEKTYVSRLMTTYKVITFQTLHMINA